MLAFGGRFFRPGRYIEDHCLRRSRVKQKACGNSRDAAASTAYPEEKNSLADEGLSKALRLAGDIGSYGSTSGLFWSLSSATSPRRSSGTSARSAKTAQVAMHDVPYVVFSGLAVIFNIVPLIWQAAHNNSGPICLGVWIIIANLNRFINGIVWRNDAINRAPVFCDISVKLQMAAPLGILAADICILLLLARVVSPSAKLVTHAARRRRALLDYLFCFGFPALVIATHVIYQPYRFGLAVTTGCLVTLVNTWPTWICYFIWAPLLSFAGCLLACYVGYRLVKHRQDFKRLVKNSDTALTTSRFVRLGLLSTAFFLLNLPLSVYNLVITVPAVGPYLKYSWRAIHYDFDFVRYDPWKTRADFGDWSSIIAGLLVLIFFGFGGEALSYYAKPLRWMGFRINGKTSRTEETGHTVTQISLKRYPPPEHSPYQEHHSASSAELDQLDYSYQGPFNRIEACGDYSDKPQTARGIKVQMSQEESVV